MKSKPYRKLKTIRFGEELLPDWTQLLDIAARLCPVSPEVRAWFSRFSSGSGTDNSRTVIEHCSLLRASIQEQREMFVTSLRRTDRDEQPQQILAAWIYALDTMIQEAHSRKTCVWIVEGTEENAGEDSDGGDITLRRV
jgi:hypothetical protein